MHRVLNVLEPVLIVVLFMGFAGGLVLLTVWPVLWSKRVEPTAHYCANTVGHYEDHGTTYIYKFEFAPCKWLALEQEV